MVSCVTQLTREGMAKKLIPRMVSVVSRVFPGVGSRIAWFLWFRPRGRKTRRYPDGAEPFSFELFGRVVSGFAVGSGDPVILLHGWGGASTDMAHLAVAVAEAGYQAIAPDLPGHGADRGSDTDVFRMASAVDAVVGMFGPPRAVIAHSFGAIVTFVAFQHGGVDRVVLVAPAVRGEWFVDVFRAHLGLGDRAFLRFQEQFVAFAGPEVMDVMRGKGDVRDAEMLILHDPADDRTPFEHATEFASARPRTKLIEVPATGHKGILRSAVTTDETVAFVTAGH
jgi:pimeloyl-ACP methyl ester carboxylesterase